VPDEWREFTDLDARWCRGDTAEKDAVRARIDEIQPRAALPASRSAAFASAEHA
jgi:hypothetical protein